MLCRLSTHGLLELCKADSKWVLLVTAAAFLLESQQALNETKNGIVIGVVLLVTTFLYTLFRFKCWFLFAVICRPITRNRDGRRSASLQSLNLVRLYVILNEEAGIEVCVILIGIPHKHLSRWIVVSVDLLVRGNIFCYYAIFNEASWCQTCHARIYAFCLRHYKATVVVATSSWLVKRVVMHLTWSIQVDLLGPWLIDRELPHGVTMIFPQAPYCMIGVSTFSTLNWSKLICLFHQSFEIGK